MDNYRSVDKDHVSIGHHTQKGPQKSSRDPQKTGLTTPLTTQSMT